MSYEPKVEVVQQGYTTYCAGPGYWVTGLPMPEERVRTNAVAVAGYTVQDATAAARVAGCVKGLVPYVGVRYPNGADGHVHPECLFPHDPDAELVERVADAIGGKTGCTVQDATAAARAAIAAMREADNA